MPYLDGMRAVSAFERPSQLTFYFEQIKKSRCAQEAVFLDRRPGVGLGHVVEPWIVLDEFVDIDWQGLPGPPIDDAARFEAGRD